MATFKRWNDEIDPKEYRRGLSVLTRLGRAIGAFRRTFAQTWETDREKYDWYLEDRLSAVVAMLSPPAQAAALAMKSGVKMTNEQIEVLLADTEHLSSEDRVNLILHLGRRADKAWVALPAVSKWMLKYSSELAASIG